MRLDLETTGPDARSTRKHGEHKNFVLPEVVFQDKSLFDGELSVCERIASKRSQRTNEGRISIITRE